MAKNAAQQAAQKKAKKQKKILILLLLLLVGAGIFAFTTLSSLGSHPAAASVTSTTPSPDGSPAGGTPVSAVIAGISASPPGSLHGFNAFGRKDPFNDAGPHGSTGDTTKTPTPSTKDKGKGKGDGSGSQPKPPVAPLTGAVISINGNKLQVATGALFGHAPGMTGVSLFRLVSVTQKTAVIGVVGTSERFTLHLRRPLTLRQNGGWTYTLVLLPPGTATQTASQTTTTTGP